MGCNRWWKRAGLLAGLALLWVAAASLPLRPLRAQSAKPAATDQTAPDSAAKDQNGAAPATATPPNAAAEKAAGESAASPTAATNGATGKPSAEAPAGPPAEPGTEPAPANGSQEPPAAPPGEAAVAAPGEPAAPPTTGGKIGWGRNFRTWSVVTGYVVSHSHGNRLVETYITPEAAAKVYKHNARLALLRKKTGYQDYPPGTEIAMESWLRNAVGAAGKPGPVFFMRKRERGYDPTANNWEYGFTRSDLTLIGTGHSGKMQFCKDCHTRVESRDFVWAVRN